jgi:dTDP-4-amino-4,6-dideoxygalactose transaminase
MKIPFVDLKAQYNSIKKEIDNAIKNVIEKCAFSGGIFVERFENEFAEYCGSKYAIGVGSGTDALWLALTALDIGKGDEVITVPNSFFATVEAICMCGAQPVLVDINEKTYNIDVHKINEVITENTKAIIPVHLYGQMADMVSIMNIARENNLYVIEDACQAHGAKYNGKYAGTIGNAGCFSFYPGKNLGAYGEAGAVITNNKDLAKKISYLRDHGQKFKYYHNHIGFNCRMDGIQGAILSVKLKYLTEWNERRRKHANLYNEILNGIDDVCCPCEVDNVTHVYHIYSIRTDHRDYIKKALIENGIQAGIHYPIPIHLQDAFFKKMNKKIKYPVTERYAKQILSLPMYPEMTTEQINYVGHEMRNALQMTRWKKELITD